MSPSFGSHTIRRGRLGAVVAISAGVVLAVVLHARPAHAEDYLGLGWVEPTVAGVGAFVGAGLMSFGIVGYVHVSSGLARGVGAPRGWALYGTVLAGLGFVPAVIFTAVGIGDAGWDHGSMLAAALPGLAVSGGLLALSIVGLANPPRTAAPEASPARRLATSFRPTVTPVFLPGSVGLAGVF